MKTNSFCLAFSLSGFWSSCCASYIFSLKSYVTLVLESEQEPVKAEFQLIMSHHDGDAEVRQANDSNQSVWMAHWRRTSSNSSSRGNSCFTLHDGSEERDCDTKNGSLLVQSKDTRKFPRLDLSVCDSNVSKTQANDNLGHVSTTCAPNFVSRLCKQPSVAVEFPSKVHCSQSESITKSYLECEKSSTSLEKKRPFQCYLPESNSNTVSYKSKSSETPVRSFICRSKDNRSICGTTSRDGFVNTKFTRLEQEPCSYFSYPTLSVSDKRTDNQLTAKIFGSSCSRRNKTLEKHEASNSISVGETGKKMLQSFSDTGISASRNIPPKFSQVIHHLLITKKAEVNLSKGRKIIGEPSLSTGFKGNAFNELLMLPPPNSNRVSTSTEGKHAMDVETDFLGSKNKLSAVTNTMDIDVCDSKKLHQGMASSISVKDFIVGETSIATQATSSLPKVGSRRTETEIPDINQEPTEFLAEQFSTSKRVLITSRTESLVKRLKLTAPDSPSHARKSPRIEDGPSSKKVDKLFTKIMNYTRSGSEPRLMKQLAERRLNFEKSVVLFKNWESSCMDSVKEHGNQSLAQCWIQRWCRNQAEVPWMKQAAAPVLVCEPDNLKATWRKQLPSIAAMALMGKATNRFRPCEFRKRGPVMVWHTEGLLEQS